MVNTLFLLTKVKHAITPFRSLAAALRWYRPPLWSKSVNAFARSHICVVGIGGVGSWAVEALARTGIGMIT